MQPIPTPHVLDPDRVLDNDRGDFTVDHQARADLLDAALHQTCAYAQQLWNNLDAVRAYLMDSLPSDPRSPGPHPTLGASPTGPDDGAGWDSWADAYAGVTSVLCGPHGDSGFGASEARDAARLRRTAPNVKVSARLHPQPGAAADLEGEHTGSSAAVDAPTPPSTAMVDSGRIFRSAGIAALVVLALRGLSPKRTPRAGT